MDKSKRNAYSFSTGRVAEVRFKRAAEKMGLDVVKSTRKEDVEQHVDYWLAHNGKGNWGVDVKGNNLPDEIWIEFKNVMGDDGWLYGDAQIIAFDMPEEGGFAIVNRLDLVDFCETHVDDIAVKSKWEAHMKKYTRRDREDVITMLKLRDLKRVKSYRVWGYMLDY